MSPYSSHYSSRPAARRPPLAASCSRRVPVMNPPLTGSWIRSFNYCLQKLLLTSIPIPHCLSHASVMFALGMLRLPMERNSTCYAVRFCQRREKATSSGRLSRRSKHQVMNNISGRKLRAFASVQRSHGTARRICHPRCKSGSIPIDSDCELGRHE